MKRRIWVFAGVLFAAILFVVLLVRPSGERFEFLSGHRITLLTNPGVPGFVQRVYSFSGNADQIGAVAERELRANGFTAHRDEQTGSFFCFRAGTSVWITPGKAAGKHFEIDGDMLDLDRSAKNWVTVEVTEPDRMAWLRPFISF